ncbi:MAG: C39 family peptidase [Peptostreptococcaceae bacterium]|nr:C39 family peptidase [Peptostreptococcaceae bacterium]
MSLILRKFLCVISVIFITISSSSSVYASSKVSNSINSTFKEMQVTTNSLNVRSGAGTKYKKVGSIKKNTKVKVYSISKGWAKIEYKNSKRYVSSQYLKNISISSSSSNNSSNNNASNPASIVKEMQVNTSVLNVRKGASTSSKKLGSIKKNTKVKVYSISKGWAKIAYKNSFGYVSSKYLIDTKVQLNVKYISQYPELPLGCEATALTQLLNYKKVNVNKITIANEMTYSPNKNPSLGFVGSPFKNEKGVFQAIYPEALESLAKKYRKSSANITGASVDTLEKEIRKGNPLVVWATLNFTTPKMGYWYEGTKDKIWVAKNLHVVAVTGVDHNYFYITDPAKGSYKVKKSTFKSIYEKVGKKALVVR